MIGRFLSGDAGLRLGNDDRISLRIQQPRGSVGGLQIVI